MGRIPVESRTPDKKSSDFLAVGPALRILQLNVEGLCSQEFHHPGHSRETQRRRHLLSALTEYK